MSETTGNSGWADFGGNAFAGAPSGGDLFGRTPSKVEKETFTPDFAHVFGTATAQKDSSNSVFGETTTTTTTTVTTTSNQEAFKADFSNVNFDAAFDTNCDERKNTVTSASDSQHRCVYTSIAF